MKKSIIGYFAAALFILAIVLIALFWKRAYTFEKGFQALTEIDQKYNTSFHTEMLNETMPAKDDIPLLIEDLAAFEKKLDSSSNDPEVRALFLFSDIRKLMLTSQWYFQFGKEIGDIGLVTDEDGFSCAESQYIIDAAFNYNESFIYGLQAEEELDDLLYMYKYHPMMWDLIGVEENRTRFYLSDLKYIRHIPLNSLKSLDVYCGMKGIKHESTFTKSFVYERELVPKEYWLGRYGTYRPSSGVVQEKGGQRTTLPA